MESPWGQQTLVAKAAKSEKQKAIVGVGAALHKCLSEPAAGEASVAAHKQGTASTGVLAHSFPQVRDIYFCLDFF